MSDDARPEDLSDLPLVEVPPNGFQSDLPEYLLKDKSEAERYILTEMSRTSAFVRWAAPILVESNASIRATNGRVKSLEAFRAMFQSWWGLVLAVLAIVGGLAGLVEVVQFIRPYLH